jgi:chromatin segregation and condensation protein Rec8/ScpA/Scc1 (kleisin family)
MANSISDRDVEKLKSSMLARLSSEEGRKQFQAKMDALNRNRQANSISDRDIQLARQIISMSNTSPSSISDRDIQLARDIFTRAETKNTTKANTISDRDRARVRNEMQRFTGRQFANGGKVDFKGSF